jgi:hypothetical protein
MFLVVLSAIVFLGVLSARTARVQYHMVQGFAQWIHIVTSFAYSTLECVSSECTYGENTSILFLIY